MINKRTGKGFHWVMEEKTANGTRITSGFTVDDLDSKNLEEAESPYEETFIMVRKALETCSSYCMDVKSERLQCVQVIADTLHGRAT